MRPLFLKGPSLLARALALTILSIILLIADYRFDLLSVARNSLSVMATPIYWLVDAPSRLLAWSGEHFQTRRELLTENEALRSEALILRGKAQRLVVLEAENQRMRELLNSSEIVRGRLQVAEIVGISPDPEVHSVVLNRGDSDGVSIGQAVLDADGLMGQVTEVHNSYSRALLISDTSHAMPVQINRNGVRAILEGIGQLDAMRLRHVSATTDIVVGDILVSSGLGGRFPAGYPVATVIEVDVDPGLAFATVIARPSAALSRSRYVLLVDAEEGRTRVQ